jgi:hypothetical protein
MATGDTKIMANYVEAMANLTPAVNWDTDAIKVGFITSSTTPDRGDSDPCWGAGGSQNYATNEVTPGGNYSAGGVTLSGCTTTQSTTTVLLAATSPITVAANASNPTNARWAIIYDNTVANKQVIGYIDLGGVTSLVPGLQINLNSVSSGTQTVFTGSTT